MLLQHGKLALTQLFPNKNICSIKNEIFYLSKVMEIIPKRGKLLEYFNISLFFCQGKALKLKITWIIVPLGSDI